MNIVLFGASGDISKKKIYPALHEWYNEEPDFINSIIGYGRSSYTQKTFRELVGKNLIHDNNNANPMKLLDFCDYQQGQYTCHNDFLKLKHKIIGYNIQKNDIIIFYFGVPSHIVSNIITNIQVSNIDRDYDCRYILEKPIGDSLESCVTILNYLNKIIDSNKIYILDHYLGKSSIMDLINKKVITKKIQILLYEKELVNHRLQYFDDIGLFKDMVQSHVLTILLYCFPDLFDFDFKNLKIISCIRGQYKEYKGTKKTETYIKLVLRWNDVDIIIEAGKGIDSDKKEIHYINDEMKNIVIPITSDFSEYKMLFMDALDKNKRRYLNSKNIKKFWELSEYIMNNTNKDMFIYDVPMIL